MTSIGFLDSIPAVATDVGAAGIGLMKCKTDHSSPARSTASSAFSRRAERDGGAGGGNVAPARSRGRRARSPKRRPDPAAEKAEQRASVDAAEHTEPNEATDPIEHAEPAEPIERKLPLDPIERNE
jgi:hypothetical protein